MIYNNSVNNWVYAGLLTVGVFIAGYFVKRIVQRHLNVQGPEHFKRWGYIAIELIKHVQIWFLLCVGLYTGTLVFTLPENVSSLISKAFFALLLLQIALIGSKAIKLSIERYRQTKIQSNGAALTTLGSVGFLIRALLWFVLLLVSLDNFGINITTLIAGLGISGIAVALAVQNILGDLFASFTIVFDKPFVIGDFIIVDDYMGTVEYVGLKTTRVRSLSGEQLIFSNGDLLKSRIRNYKRMQERRVVFTINVTYQTPYDELNNIPQLLKSIIEGQKNVRFDRAHFKEYGTYSLNFEIVYWILNPDYNVYMDIQQAINLSIYRRFQEIGIQFAYPTQKLLLGQNENTSNDPISN
jgi:small-conductance mechanosensitive channel